MSSFQNQTATMNNCSAFEAGCVPEGPLRIAQRLSAGSARLNAESPAGTAEPGPWRSAVLAGLVDLLPLNPALKRGAIFSYPSAAQAFRWPLPLVLFAQATAPWARGQTTYGCRGWLRGGRTPKRAARTES
jgi:hypothetical protein